MPKISIIIPVYKVEKYLRCCLDSIVNQTFTDWECILVDDGSPDNSGKICDEYAVKDNRFRVFHQKNAGVSAARNKGLDEARGEWITFVDSDDWLELNTYETILNKVNGNVNVVCFGIKYCYRHHKIKNVEFQNNGNLFYKFRHYKVYMHSPCNKLYLRNVILEKRFYVGIKTCEDLLFNYDIMTDQNVKIEFLNDNLYCYNMISENSSRNIVLEEACYDSFYKVYLEMCKLNEVKKISDEYLRFFSTCAAMPYINHLHFFNPDKFREICIKWSFNSYHPKIFFQFLCAFLKLDLLAKLILEFKHIIRIKSKKNILLNFL